MICVSIGDDRIKMVAGTASKSKITIKKYVSVETGSASTEEGVLKDKSEFAQVLQGLIDESGVKEKSVNVVMDNHRIVLKDMEMPYVAEKRLKLLIANETATENKNVVNIVDYLLDEVYTSDEKKRKCRLKVSFLQKEVVEQIKDVVLELGLKPKSIDIAPNAMQKLIGTYKGGELDEVFVLMDYKTTYVTIYLFAKQKLLFTKSNMMYARPTKDNETEYEFFYSELINLLQSVIQFAATKYNYYPSRVYLTGELSPIKDSLQDLADSLSMGVRQLTASAGIKGIDADEFNETGALLGGMIRR